MPLRPDMADDYAQLREDNKRSKYQIAAAKVVEVSATAASTETVTIAANADSGWHSLSGPAVSVTTDSGKIIVTVSARISIGSANSNSQAGMSWELINDSGAVVAGPDLSRGVYAIYKGGMGAVAQSAFTFAHEGLPPGTYTVRSRYRYWDGPGSMGGTWWAEYSNRSLIAKAY